MPEGKEQKAARDSRAERLEAELRANLKRRKDQARARANAAVAHDADGNSVPAADPRRQDSD